MENAPRIEIEENGPYLLYGDIPLSELAPVMTFNGEPVEWHTLREIAPEGDPVELCRCGQSSQKPFCDLTHLVQRFDGTETADRRPLDERSSTRRHGEDAITGDSRLCWSAGFCGTRTTNIWRLLEESEDPAKQELMRDMIWHCPAGRLILLDAEGNEVEPELPQDVAVLPGGPLWVRGGIPITGSDGTQWEVSNRVTLCRCGQSANKPFCDGTHASLHFDAR